MKPEFEKKKKRLFKEVQIQNEKIWGTKINISTQQLWKNQKRTLSPLRHE